MPGITMRVQRVVMHPKVINDKTAEALIMAMEAAVIDAKTNLDTRLPKTARAQSGKLRQSITFLNKGKYTKEFVARARDWGRKNSYAMSVEEGSRPHIIEARRKPNLAFPWENAPSGYFVGPVVYHPGFRGVHFMWDAAKRIPERFSVFMRMVLR